MTTARNMIKKRMKKHGNTLLGVGVYSAVIDQGSTQNKVIKIGNTLSDPWLAFYQDAIEHANNPHFPTVYSFHYDRANEYYVAVVEKLLPEHPEGNATNSNLSCYTDVEELWYAVLAVKEIRDDTWDDETGEYEYAIDMHAGNLMFRQDGTLVLNDPLSDTEIEYEDDLAQWVEEHMGVKT